MWAADDAGRLNSIGSRTTDTEIDLMVTVYALSAFGWTASALVFLVIWVLIAFWPARVARRKGHSFIVYFIFSLIFFPLALLTAARMCAVSTGRLASSCRVGRSARRAWRASLLRTRTRVAIAIRLAR
jgi:hypothetical protein